MTMPPAEDTATRASLELLYHISRELSTALDLGTVLKRVLFLSMRNLGAARGSIIVLDEKGQPVESALIVDNVVHHHTTNRLRSTLEHGLAGWVAQHRQAALVSDTTKDKRWLVRQYDKDEQPGPKSVVSAPLLTRDVLIGVITIVQPGVNYFNTEHLSLVQAIADQAAVAVLNARLYAESQRQAQVMTALVQSANKISVSLNLDDVLKGIMEQTSQALNTQGVSLALLDSPDGKLVLRAANSQAGYKVMDLRFRVGQGVAGWVAQHGEGVIIQNAEKDPRFDPQIDTLPGMKTHSIACAPIHYHGQVIGVLSALNAAGRFFEDDAMLLLTGIGSLAGTAIRHAQLFEKLNSAHQSYRELFEDSIDPIFITNWDGLILEANRQAVTTTDFSVEIIRGMYIGQVFTLTPDLLGENFANLRSGATLEYTSTLFTRSGHELPIQVVVRKVLLESSPRLQWILRDLTERKKLDTLRNDLTSMIYHDLRSPLANVVSSLDVLKSMMTAGENMEIMSLLEIALRSTERIQRLTDSLLDMSRLEAGLQIVDLHAVEVSDLLHEAVDTVVPVIHSKNQALRIDILPALPPILADPDMIRRVIINLLENATKYTHQGGCITLSACRDGDMIQIKVTDNGPGIPASEHERIFDKFSRLKLEDAPKGLGLGLAYCRLAIQAQGGKIWVESEPGSGSSFIFVLPVAA